MGTRQPAALPIGIGSQVGQIRPLIDSTYSHNRQLSSTRIHFAHFG